MDRGDEARRQSGLPVAVSAQVIWGVLPLYLLWLKWVPAVELVGLRMLFALPFCLLFIALRGQRSELCAILRDWKVLRLLLLSAVLVAANWLIYVVAIQAGHVYAASFGYYVTPLVQVLAGTLFIGERLGPMQWIAVALAAVGVGLLGLEDLSMLWLSLALAMTWSSYGLIRKLTPVGALPGLSVETMVLLPVAIGIVGWYALQPPGSSFGRELGGSLAIALAGPFTVVPLTLYAMAARRMDFTSLGMLQFLSPTIVFVLGLTLLGLPLHPVQAASFAIIWVAIGLFVWDLVQRRSAGQAPA
jgi:chloramphenicol-sensitive protein RarD